MRRHLPASGLSPPNQYRLPGAASRLAALLIAHLCPIGSLFAPGDPGAALRQSVPIRRREATRGPTHARRTRVAPRDRLRDIPPEASLRDAAAHWRRIWSTRRASPVARMGHGAARPGEYGRFRGRGVGTRVEQMPSGRAGLTGCDHSGRRWHRTHSVSAVLTIRARPLQAGRTCSLTGGPITCRCAPRRGARSKRCDTCDPRC